MRRKGCGWRAFTNRSCQPHSCRAKPAFVPRASDADRRFETARRRRAKVACSGNARKVNEESRRPSATADAWRLKRRSRASDAPRVRGQKNGHPQDRDPTNATRCRSSRIEVHNSLRGSDIRRRFFEILGDGDWTEAAEWSRRSPCGRDDPPTTSGQVPTMRVVTSTR